MSKITEAARGMPCQVRLPGCDGGGETTVHSHYRLAGYCGVGTKPPDVPFGTWACDPCHAACDGRRHIPGYTKDQIRLAHSDGCKRTIHALIERGLVTVTGRKAA